MSRTLRHRALSGLALCALLTASVLTGTVSGGTAAALAGGSGMPALVVLVRHAEKAASSTGDPPLTKAGRERARALVVALKDTAIDAIITSEAKRTRETAEPLAQARGLTPTVVSRDTGGRPDHAAAVAAEVRRHAGGVVVVVGHSDTVPLIIEALGGPRFPEISSGEFSNLFLLVPGPAGARLVRAHYGAPDPGS